MGRGCALAAPLAACRHRQGILAGKVEAYGVDLAGDVRLETLADDVVKSSAIEGERLEPVEVRSSIASQLGMDLGGRPPAGRAVEGVVRMTLDATANCARAGDGGPAVRLAGGVVPGWAHRDAVHHRGALRPASAGPMQVVSGPIGRQRVHFEAPAAGRLGREIKRFVRWVESPDRGQDPVLRAGLAHLWFLTIHPFEDGNGRVARALTDLLLTRADGADRRFYSVSAQVEAERKRYYLELERAHAARSTPRRGCSGSRAAWSGQWFRPRRRSQRR